MNILIAVDSFKESLTATQACRAIQTGWTQIAPQTQFQSVPMADGGEGTTEALIGACGGEWVSVPVSDPLGRPIMAQYGRLPNGTVVMEMSQAAGLHLLTPAERNPLITSTYGFGEMIAHALLHGAKQLILGIGGSATNDGGAGMLQALGITLQDNSGNELKHGGGQLQQLAHIDLSGCLLRQFPDVSISVACDVVNPLCGETGASVVFAPQKGATPDMIAQLDKNLNHFANVVAANLNLPSDCHHQAGCGAAGGLGFGLSAVLGGTLRSGIDLVCEATELSEKMAQADLVITGEGRMDGQTAFGKVPMGVLKLAQKHGVPVIGLSGSVSEVEKLYELGFAAVFPSIDRVASLPEILRDAEHNLIRTARNIAAVYHHFDFSK